jgi:glycosyl hydrolase family 9
VLDFTDLEVRGVGLWIAVGSERSNRFEVSSRLYYELRVDALRFFYLMRSGTRILDSIAPGYGRPAGHAGRPPNRGDKAVRAWTGIDAEQLYPGWRCEGVFDVSGGWYDAGDYGKYVTSGAIAAWQLLSTIDLLRKTKSACIKGLVNPLVNECRWQLDWLLRMRVPAGDPLSGMAFHRVHGTQWSPMPGWPHEDPTERVLHRPSTGATLQLAAVAAQGARLLRGTDPAYAATLLNAAGVAYEAAQRQGWDWGSNGRILNNLVVLAVAHLLSGDSRYAAAVAEGMDYLLGRNALGQSYITGYGSDYSAHQRTRQFGHDLDPAFPPPPPGALAGGANSRPSPDFPYDSRLVGLPPQCCYLDEPTSEVTNDVCIRWNAPLVWIATYLSSDI